MPGGSIKYLLDKYGPMCETLIKKYLKQVLNGLEYLHKNGIVHRDIKAANILVDLKGNIKLSDFGCASQLLQSSLGESELLNSLKGTLAWMAPEVVCQSKYGKKADVWSLGCTLIEMATGTTPWGKFKNYVQALQRIGLSKDIPDIPTDISDNLKDFISLCLKRIAADRPTIMQLKEHPFLN